jgi:hypothetical protein
VVRRCHPESMDGVMVAGWRTIRRTPVLWAYPVVVGLAALICMPLNEFLVEQVYIDPQGDDFYAFYYSKLAWRHTSGFVAGTLAALVYGVVLGGRTGRSGIGRLSGAGALAWAAAGGAVLALVNAGVAFLAGGPKHLSVVWAGDLYAVDLFQADGPWRVVVVWAALFPVAAVAGAALSALATRRP